MLAAIVIHSIGEDAVGLGLLAVAALAAIRWGHEFGREG